MLESGCCGMAGAFGFEAEKYDLSLAMDERVLLPAVRQAAKETLVIADGFSCREQIAQATGRRALYTAQCSKWPRATIAAFRWRKDSDRTLQLAIAVTQPRRPSGGTMAILGAVSFLAGWAIYRNEDRERSLHRVPTVAGSALGLAESKQPGGQP